jgi:hypothetical protein
MRPPKATRGSRDETTRRRLRCERVDFVESAPFSTGELELHTVKPTIANDDTALETGGLSLAVKQGTGYAEK